MKGAPRSKQFDDVYFSADNGLKETHHVFLQGNNLPSAWQEAEMFTIVETGFGTGLNFLATWKLFEQTAPADAELDFVSFEKFPLSVDEIKDALSAFPEISKELLNLLEKYPPLVPGFHRIVLNDRVRLTLIFDDINESISELNANVDCWFLDGFTPAKNPDMWTDTVFRNMTRLSRSGASFATFTAAGFVKRGLQDAGFDAQKKEGFGRKRDMLTGHYKGDFSPRQKNKKSVAIIGGGLSGASCAYVLKSRGLNPVIYEKGEGVAASASGNSLGLVNPRFCAHRNGDSDFYTASFLRFLRTAPALGDIDLRAVGALHLMNTSEKEKRFKSLVGNWSWPNQDMRIVSEKEASDIAKISIDQEALYLPHSVSVDPSKICERYAKDIEIKTNQDIKSLDQIDADYIILAGGFDMKDFVPWLPVHSVRGQVTTIKTPEVLKNLGCNIHYGGYINASHNGENRIGATFQKWIDHTNIVQEDHDDNITKLKSNIDGLGDVEVVNGWAGLRTASQDRFPIAGKVPDMDNIFISTGHASHGLVSSIGAAHLITDMICGSPHSLSQSSMDMLSPQRFIDRARKKGKVLEGFKG